MTCITCRNEMEPKEGSRAALSRAISQMNASWLSGEVFVCSVQVHPSLQLLLLPVDCVDKHKGRTVWGTLEALSNVSAAIEIQFSGVCARVKLYRVLMQDSGLLELVRPERGTTVAAWTQYIVWGFKCSIRSFLGQPVVSWICGSSWYTWRMITRNMRHNTLYDQKEVGRWPFYTHKCSALIISSTLVGSLLAYWGIGV